MRKPAEMLKPNFSVEPSLRVPQKGPVTGGLIVNTHQDIGTAPPGATVPLKEDLSSSSSSLLPPLLQAL